VIALALGLATASAFPEHPRPSFSMMPAESPGTLNNVVDQSMRPVQTGHPSFTVRARSVCSMSRGYFISTPSLLAIDYIGYPQVTGRRGRSARSTMVFTVKMCVSPMFGHGVSVERISLSLSSPYKPLDGASGVQLPFEDRYFLIMGSKRS
jgi:hypothetical protein